MNIGVPREAKEGERRVALLPDAIAPLVSLGARVLVETCAGTGVGANDDAYRAAGASIVTTEEAWRADLVVKVKEIQDADLAPLPEGATRILESPYCANQAYVLGKHLGMQCHVEMTRAMIEAWCAVGRGEIAAARSPAVQTPEQMAVDIDARLAALNGVADRLYTRWIAGLKA